MEQRGVWGCQNGNKPLLSRTREIDEVEKKGNRVFLLCSLLKVKVGNCVME